MDIKCIICRFICDSENTLKINSTFTVHSKLPLKDFLGIVTEKEINFVDDSICRNCYDLLNELEKFRENYLIGCKRIKQSLNYLFETDILENTTNVESEIPETRLLTETGTNDSTNQKDTTKYICEICGGIYRSKESLVVHGRIHKGIKPFNCEFCDKSFTQKICLSKHLPTHTGELPYQCDLCGKRYRYASSLSIHKKTHHGRKDVKCESCDAMFFTKASLIRHRKSHTHEKRFECSDCGKKFAERYNLTVHKKIHQKVKDGCR